MNQPKSPNSTRKSSIPPASPHKGNLRLFRTSLGITQKQMAIDLSEEKKEIKQARYSHYENNARDIPSEILIRLAEKHNLNIHWLITGKGPQKLTSDEWGVISESGASYSTSPSSNIKYSAILFFSEHDRNLARAFCKLADILNEPVFCSSESSHSSGDEQYMKSIVSRIKQSACIVPIVSRHSLQRSLWFFEIGVAKGRGCEIFPGIVRGLSRYEDGFQTVPLALNFDHYNKLYTKDGLIDLFVKIANAFRGENKSRRLELEEKIITHKQEITLLIEEASARPVFIAGSPTAEINPQKDPEYSPNSGKIYPWKEWTKSESNFKARGQLSDFCEKLAEELILRRFTICTNPHVKMVGKPVYEKAEALIDQLKKDLPPDSFEYIPALELGGIPAESFKILFESASRTESGALGKKQKEQFINIHRTYLKGKEWFIVIGGNRHTWQEYTSIQFFNRNESASIKVFSFPCFGGAAFAIHKRLPESARGPCIDCLENKEHLKPGCSHFSKIVDLLFNTYP